MVRELSAVEEVRGVDAEDSGKRPLTDEEETDHFGKHSHDRKRGLLYLGIPRVVEREVRREAVLSSPFSRLEPSGAWLSANAVVGETRSGLNEGSLMDAVASACRLRRETWRGLRWSWGPLTGSRGQG